MKNIINIGLLICLMSGGFLACKDDKSDPIEPVAELMVNSESIVFQQGGGDVALTIKTNRGWAAMKGEGDWYGFVGSDNGKAGESNIVTLQAIANQAGATRTSTVTVKAGGEERVVTVSQFGTDPAIILPEKQIKVKYEGEMRMVSVQSNVAIQVKSLSDWVTLVTPNYSSMPSDVYYVNVTENTGAERTGKLVFFSDKGLSDTLAIVQEEVQDVLEMTQKAFSIDGLRDEVKIEFRTSKVWTVSFLDPQPEWITGIAPMTGAKGTSAVTVSLKSTDVTASENCRLLFTCGEKTETVTLTLIPTTARGRDSMAVVKLYRSAVSTGEDKWDFTQPMDTWDPRGLQLDRKGRVTKFQIYKWKFNEFPKEFGLLDMLKTLNFSACEFNFTEFPEEFGSLVNLEELTFWGSPKIPAFPASVKAFTKLKTLFFGATEFDPYTTEMVFPEVFMECTNIERLQMRSTTLTDIPAAIGKLTKLNYLDLTGSKLKAIPASLSQLGELNYLCLNNNEMTGSIPASLFTGTKLATCYLSNNKLEGDLPADIFKLMTLVDINVANNNITGELPEEILTSKITQISLSGNRMGQAGGKGHFPAKIREDERFYGGASSSGAGGGGGWNAAASICPQQEGYGWIDCTLQ